MTEKEVRRGVVVRGVRFILAVTSAAATLTTAVETADAGATAVSRRVVKSNHYTFRLRHGGGVSTAKISRLFPGVAKCTHIVGFIVVCLFLPLTCHYDDRLRCFGPLYVVNLHRLHETEELVTHDAPTTQFFEGGATAMITCSRSARRFAALGYPCTSAF